MDTLLTLSNAAPVIVLIFGVLLALTFEIAKLFRFDVEQATHESVMTDLLFVDMYQPMVKLGTNIARHRDMNERNHPSVLEAVLASATVQGV